jgi:exopolysaccharide biosynthesis polyprenyl glycosylphosphotransferase
MVKNQRKFFFLIQALYDIVSVFIAFLLCCYLSALFSEVPHSFPDSAIFHQTFFNLIYFNFKAHFTLFLYFIFLPVLSSYLTRNVRYNIYIGIGRVSFKLFFAFTILGCICNLSALFFSSPFSNLFFCNSMIVLSGLLFILNRYFFELIIKHKPDNSNLIKHILIAGIGKEAAESAGTIKDHPEWGIRVIGFISPEEKWDGKSIDNIPVIGNINDLPYLMDNHVIDGLLYTEDTGMVKNREFLKLRCEVEGIEFSDFSNFFKSTLTVSDKFSLNSISEILFIKRAIDHIAATVFIIIFLPFWIIIPILIKIDSSGPVFFRQKRVGKNGRAFTMYKFRSMVENAENMQNDIIHLNEMDGPAFKIKEDPRQTGVGKFLRNTSIDELPQLLNVFKGDISLVGPRPPIREEVEQYRPWEKKRLSVIQGISCLWQISGRNEIKFDEWMKLDLMYVENRSLALDFIIMLKTISAVLSRKGAR